MIISSAASKSVSSSGGEGGGRPIERRAPVEFKKEVFIKPEPLSEPPIIEDDRSHSGRVLFHFNCKNLEEWIPKLEEDDPKVKVLGNQFKMAEDGPDAFKYLHQRSSEVTLALDHHISSLSSQIAQDHSLESLEDLSKTYAEPVNFAGRIRDDGTKLNEDSIYFEGPLSQGGGHVVQLDLGGLEECFLFPGQILGVEGLNNMGKMVSVSKIYAPLPLPRLPLDEAIDSGPLNMVIGAGPFTQKNSLRFEPLADLGRVVVECKPQLCILIGPFLDASHPLIEEDTGDLVSETFEELFHKQLEAFANQIAQTGTKLLLVSSSKDVFHHLVYPTPPYLLQGKLKGSVVALSDPSFASINGITFGFTSTDILMHLSRNEWAKTMGLDRMARLCRHVITQRNFYPLNPQDPSVPLDFPFWAEYGQMDSTPHVLLLPSDLRYFIKDVDGTLVINPERLTKGNSRGTYVRLQIDLSKNKGSDSVVNYSIGQIIKI